MLLVRRTHRPSLSLSPQDCAPGAVPFRDLQCALYNGLPVLGTHKTYQWVPFHGGECGQGCVGGLGGDAGGWRGAPGAPRDDCSAPSAQPVRSQLPRGGTSLLPQLRPRPGRHALQPRRPGALRGRTLPRKDRAAGLHQDPQMLPVGAASPAPPTTRPRPTSRQAPPLVPGSRPPRQSHAPGVRDTPTSHQCHASAAWVTPPGPHPPPTGATSL